MDRLRLFCSGRELEDSKTVNGTYSPSKIHYYPDLSTIASAAGFAAVHVTVVNKLAKGAAGAERDDEHGKAANKCLCSIM